jgi:GNAT superfamily N-acetyltransferase
LDIVVAPVNQLNSATYKKLYSLNLREHGLMRDHLRDAYMSDRTGHVTIFRKNEQAIIATKDGIVLGWALLLDQRLSIRGKFKKVVHVYVRKAERKHGIARTLVEKAIELCNGEKLYCRGNTRFFRKFNIRHG